MEILRETFRSLFDNKLRTFLSMLGIIIGVAAVMTIIAIGDGAREEINRTVSSLGSNIIMVTSSIFSRFASDPLEFKDAINITTMVPGVANATGLLASSYVVEIHGKNTTATVLGVLPGFFEIMNLDVVYGRPINEEDSEELRSSAVIGYNIADKLFGRQEVIGERFNIIQTGSSGSRKITFEVVGVLKKTGSRLLFNIDDLVILPHTVADHRLFHASGRTGQILVSAIDEKSADLARMGIDFYLYRKFEDSKKYTILSQDAILDAVNQITGIFNVILVGIASISLVVGGIGIMNIMLVTVKERTREIGIKMAIGASRRRILLEFLLESVVLTVIAGIIGMILGVFLSGIIVHFGKAFGLSAVFTVKSILLSFGVSAAIGLFFGIYPANQASKLSPVEALRYE
ncbi:MAG TPA: ABC transporter permease [Defluviitoga sp.]|nr:ABC transporter permease [Defluviitoga sp.]HOP24735.1 ABC transporter permease [Defluviitoga sp.]HPZ28304.1 ABC transporter permease [Defluviitoga sp.]HQD62194.1 ABC transporter permease [Defluviitoga sp.]